MFVVGVIFLLVMFIPCWLGIRLGATFATVLGIVTIIPLVLLFVLPFFKPGSLDGFGNLDGFGSASPIGAKGSWQLILGWSFIYTWTVLAMEAARVLHRRVPRAGPRCRRSRSRPRASSGSSST